MIELVVGLLVGLAVGAFVAVRVVDWWFGKKQREQRT